MDKNLAVTGDGDADGWMAADPVLQIIITRRGCICEKCEVFLQDMATTAQLRIVGG